MILPYELSWAGRPLFIDLNDVLRAYQTELGRASLTMKWTSEEIVVDDAYDKVKKALVTTELNRFIEVTAIGRKTLLKKSSVKCVEVNELGQTILFTKDDDELILDDSYEVVKASLLQKEKERTLTVFVN